MNPPLAVLRYLAELDAALAARNAPDRDQIVTQIGEHITQALGDRPDPSEAEIAAVLAELGDPLHIADEAAPPSPGDIGSRTEPPAPPSPPAFVPPRQPLLARSWIPAVTIGLWAIGAAKVLVPLLVIGTGPQSLGIILAAVALNIPLVASIVLVFVSPLFRPPGRWTWLVCVPIALLVDYVGGQGRFDPSYFAPNTTLATVLMAVPPVAAICAVVMITIRAYRRATPAVPHRDAPAAGRTPATR